MNSGATTTEEATGPNLTPVKIYFGIYLALIVLYAFSLLTGSQTLKPDEFLARAFPGPTGVSTKDMRALFDKEKGHLRIWSELSFRIKHDGAELTYILPAGNKLTRNDAVALATAIRETPEQIGGIVIHKDGVLANLPWAYGLTSYNLLGLFLVIITFLKTPVNSLLKNNAAATARAVEEARSAKAEAELLKNRYQELLDEIEAEKASMSSTMAEEIAEERVRILTAAKHDAEGTIQNLRASIDAEIALASTRLKQEVAVAALKLAREAIEKEATVDHHNADVDNITASIRKVSLS